MDQGQSVEDIEACAREGRRPRDEGPYQIRLGDALMRFQTLIAPSPTLTGRELLDLAGRKPVDDFVLFVVQTDGLLEEIRLDETVDLRAGVEKLLAFDSDRILRFMLDGREFNWGGVFISGATLLSLARLDPATHGVWLQGADAPSRPIGPTELVDLARPGVEHFVTGPLGQAPG
jgi:hypothetical protein